MHWIPCCYGGCGCVSMEVKDINEIKKDIDLMLQTNDTVASMNAEVRLARQVPKLLRRLENAEKHIKRYGRGSEALCRAFGVTDDDGQKRVALTREELEQRFKIRLRITDANPNGIGLGRTAFYEMLNDIFGEEEDG